MPIAINLLAEAQAAEEMRRRDPVKRGIWVGGLLVCLVGLWILKLQLDINSENAREQRLVQEWQKKEANYKQVVDAQTKIADIETKLAALDRVQTNRFLWASILNALQKTTVEHITVTRIKTEQTFQNIEAKSSGKVMQPAAVVEQAGLTIEARDWNVAGETYKKFQDTLSNYDYFLRRLQRRDGFIFNGTLSPVSSDSKDPTRQSVSFTLAARFPEVRRSE